MAAIRWPQLGHVDGGQARSKRPFRACAGTGTAFGSSSAHWARHASSIMIGSRYATTFRKLPTIRPKRTTNSKSVMGQTSNMSTITS
jgi:hypothetical protein